MTAMNSSSALRILFLVAFLEGGALMATEIAGARLVAPFYGNSLYVWAAVLGLTLAGLASGYFLGAALSRRPAALSTLHGMLLLAALFVAIMPWSAAAVMGATLGMDLRLGITVSCLIFLVPPLVCFGTVSPLIIRLASTSADAAGHVAGKVYAISTLGGIIATLGVAFWTIPEIGLWQTFGATALLTAVIPTLYFCGVPALRMAPAAG
jgi:predicted membrane-bound spermidine synthase